MSEKKRVLVLCTGNSARSQTAEGFHWSIEDPAEAQGDEESRSGVFRRVRDELRHRLRLFAALSSK